MENTTKNTKPRFTVEVNPSLPATFTNASGVADATGLVNTQVICTAANADTLVRGISITSTDPAARDILVYKQYLANDGVAILATVLLGFINVPLHSGGLTGVNPAVSGLTVASFPFLPSDAYNNAYMTLRGKTRLLAGVRGTAVTAGAQIQVAIEAEDFAKND